MNTHCKHMSYVHDIIIFVVVVVLCNKKFNTKVSLNKAARVNFYTRIFFTIFKSLY